MPRGGKRPVKRAAKKAVPAPQPVEEPDDMTERLPEVVKVKNGRRKIDWGQVEAAFVEGVPVDVADPDGDRDWVNLRELSDRMGIPYQSVRERAASDRWTAKRQAYQEERAIERRRKREETIGTRAIEFDDNTMKAAELGQKLVLTRMAEIAKDVQIRAKVRERALAMQEQGYPIQKEDLYSAIYPGDLERLGNALARFQDIRMGALGDVDKAGDVIGISGDVTINVTEELSRPDGNRIAGFLSVLSRTPVMDEVLDLLYDDEGNLLGEDEEEIVEAEIVEEGEDE